MSGEVAPIAAVRVPTAQDKRPAISFCFFSIGLALKAM